MHYEAVKEHSLGQREKAKLVANVHIELRLNAGLITTITLEHLDTTTQGQYLLDYKCNP